MVGNWTIRVEDRTHHLKAELPLVFLGRQSTLTVYVDGQPIYQNRLYFAVDDVGRFGFYGHDCVVRASGFGHLFGKLELLIGGHNADRITELPNLLRRQ